MRLALPLLIAALALPVAKTSRLPTERLAAGSYAARAVDGAKIANKWCDTCHLVRHARGPDVAPTFAQIAVQRTPEQIRAFLAHPHGGMPPIELSNKQIDDVIAYMNSLLPDSDATPGK